MTREDAKNYILSHATDYLERDKSGKGWICPICGSGSGTKGTGITTADRVHFTCWAGCFQHSDIIDVIGKQYGLTEFNDKLEKACGLFGIALDHPAGENYYQPKSEQNTQQNIHNSDYTIRDTQLPKETDYTTFYSEVSKDIERTSYHRDISLATLQRFNIGYVENWKHPKCTSRHTPTPRMIIPTSAVSYIARATRPLTDEEKDLGIVEKSKVGKAHIFNLEALKTAQKPIVIVEGEIDAMSIVDVGGEAIGLGGVGNVKKLLTILEADRPAQPLIIALDNDEAGEKACKELREGLERLGITYTEERVSGEYKDSSEALHADREAFTAKIQEAENIWVEADREELKRESALCSVEDFRKRIRESGNRACISTGFNKINTILDGGLYAGLYVVGAISSLGKTTFTLQLADNIAQSGTDVLIFSLEMAKHELIAKSVSRLTYQLDQSSDHRDAKTTRGILTGYKDSTYYQKELIDQATMEYADRIAEHIYITEGMGNVDIRHIVEKVKKHTRVTGKSPVVLVDYLQLIAPSDMRASDKQNTDIAVTALKRLSRDFDIPVIAISSFNRQNYTEPVNLTAFKESGAIEYSSDVLIGLQYKGMDYEDSEKEANRESRIRQLLKENVDAGKVGKAQKIQVKILKNRNGSKGDCTLFYTPMFNHFSEVEETKPKADTDKKDLFSSGY